MRGLIDPSSPLTTSPPPHAPCWQPRQTRCARPGTGPSHQIVHHPDHARPVTFPSHPSSPRSATEHHQTIASHPLGWGAGASCGPPRYQGPLAPTVPRPACTPPGRWFQSRAYHDSPTRSRCTTPKDREVPHRCPSIRHAPHPKRTRHRSCTGRYLVGMRPGPAQHRWVPRSSGPEALLPRTTSYHPPILRAEQASAVGDEQARGKCMDRIGLQVGQAIRRKYPRDAQVRAPEHITLT